MTSKIVFDPLTKWEKKTEWKSNNLKSIRPFAHYKRHKVFLIFIVRIENDTAAIHTNNGEIIISELAKRISTSH